MDGNSRLFLMLASDLLKLWDEDLAHDVRMLSNRPDLPEGWKTSKIVRLFNYTPPVADDGTNHIDMVHRNNRDLGTDEPESYETERVMKPKVENESKDLECLRLRAVDQKGNEVMFKIKTTTTMENLKKGYAERMGSQNVANFRFRFDGQKIRDKDTPASLDLKNDDVINVYEEQEGGYFG